MSESKRIRVCGPDRMCFPADARTLEPLACSTYDPWCWTDPQPGQMGVAEWNRRRDEERRHAHP